LPYESGELPTQNFAVNPGIDGLSEDLLVYVPQYNSSYVLVIFLGGLVEFLSFFLLLIFFQEGNIPVGAYGDVLSNIASHGAIVVTFNVSIFLTS
jgi:hypothetical protein